MNEVRREVMMQSMRDMEDALLELRDSPDIWQHDIISALCRAVWLLLEYVVKKK